jgi:hypothetical protein
MVGDKRLPHDTLGEKGEHAAVSRAKNSIAYLAAVDRQRTLNE